MAALFGPICMGIGTAMLIKCKASSGGSDVIAMIISRYLRVKFSNALMAVIAQPPAFPATASTADRRRRR